MWLNAQIWADQVVSAFGVDETERFGVGDASAAAMISGFAQYSLAKRLGLGAVVVVVDLHRGFELRLVSEQR